MNRELRKNVNSNEMTIEQFQKIANKHMATGRARIEPIKKVVQQLEVLPKEEGVLYYVQSLSSSGVDSQTKIELSDVNYFTTEVTNQVLVNDFICEKIEVTKADTITYVVGLRAEMY